jgi:hypothetical protein
MKNSLKIQFFPSSLEVESFVEKPSPAKNEIPEWYQSIKSTFKKFPIFDHEVDDKSKFPGNIFNSDIKACMPFFDSMTSGYIQKTWCDIYIKPDQDRIGYTYASNPEIMGYRSKNNIKFFNKEFYPYEFYWKSPWIFKTPTGYSTLVISPINRNDLPFVTVSGIIDSDVFYHTKFGNIPFYIKNGFSGLIPAGTPMYQIIPIKRDRWLSVSECYNSSIEKRHFMQKRVFWNFYKKSFWKKKEYN